MLTALIIGVFNESYLWMKSAKELGYKVIAVHPMDLSEKYYYEQTKPYIDEFYKVDYSNHEKLLQIAQSHNISFVICHPASNDATLAASRINTELRLKGVDYNSASIACNKYEFYKFLEKNNLPGPRFTYKLDSVQYQNITYPCLVKPSFGAGSVGVKIIENELELQKFYKEQKYDDGFSLSKSSNDFYIVQEYLKGKKIMGCHSVVDNGTLKIFGRTYRYLDQEHTTYPYCYGQEFITTHEEITQKTQNAIDRLITSIGFDNTPFDLEILLDENNNIISFIELNLRPAEKAFNYISGRNGYEYCIKEQVKLGTSLPCDFSPIGNSKMYTGVKYFVFPHGTIEQIIWPSLPANCVYFNSKLTKNSYIKNLWNVNIAVDNGSMIVIDHSYEAVKSTFDNFTKQIQIEYQ